MADMFPTIPTGAPPQAGDKIGRVPAFDSETNRFLLLDGALVERQELVLDYDGAQPDLFLARAGAWLLMGGMEAEGGQSSSPSR